MTKLGTAFTPITNPAGTRLLTLMDESTGERFKINITDFFALVASGATFSETLTINTDTAQKLIMIDPGGTKNFSLLTNNLDELHIRNESDSLSMLSFTATGNATFSGVLSVNATDPELSLKDSSNADYNFRFVNDNSELIIRDQTAGVNRMIFSATGVVTIVNLAGTGTRNVVVDANGVMSAP